MSTNQNPAQATDQDQRYLPRWEVRSRVLFRTDEDAQTFHEAYTRDIHAGGLCLTTEQDFQLNEKVRMNVQIADDISIQMEGRVVWAKHIGGEKLFGVEFTNIDPSTQDVILEKAFQVDRGAVYRQIPESRRD